MISADLNQLFYRSKIGTYSVNLTSYKPLLNGRLGDRRMSQCIDCPLKIVVVVERDGLCGGLAASRGSTASHF